GLHKQRPVFALYIIAFDRQGTTVLGAAGCNHTPVIHRADDSAIACEHALGIDHCIGRNASINSKYTTIDLCSSAIVAVALENQHTVARLDQPAGARDIV